MSSNDRDTPEDRTYDHGTVEKAWAHRWEQSGIYRVDLRTARKPFYNLMMFPYPSAEGLHVGHPYAYTGSDIQGRAAAMLGFDVFEPMGFDAFGIHSENYAIKIGSHPKTLTARSVERFRETQLKLIGARFDWAHEVNTTDPGYYRWTQWIFVQLFKAGLAYKAKAPVNWCPTDKTVLADEQVIDGRCERCGTEVERRELEQWFLRITSYAEKLLRNLDTLDWSEKVKVAQRNWIGRSEGLEFSLAVDGHTGNAISVFTTRPDTVFGMTYVVLAPEHRLVDVLTTPDQLQAVRSYQAIVRRQSDIERLRTDKDKTGVFIGSYAVNPANGERVPIWMADYVLGTYGTGAIMAVPAHDERDYAFARQFGLPIVEVVKGGDIDSGAYVGAGELVNSGSFTGLSSDEGSQRIIEWFEDRRLGNRKVNYRLRDWLISRQRYWGPPIPIIYCDHCGTVPVPEQDLPVLLPDVEDYMPTGTGSSPLARVDSFVNTRCPRCNAPARRETDVSDNFLDSAWYYLRYPSTEFQDRPFDAELTKKWLPVDMYVGGAEHSVLHLLYSRFISMALHDLGFIDFDEPFTRFRAHGLLIKDGAKMSKSLGNVVLPDEYIAKYGADTLRMYLMFMGPYEQGGDFSDRGIAGMRRFLVRVWDLVNRRSGTLRKDKMPVDELRTFHRFIKRIREDTLALKYNTAIAAFMQHLNELQRREALYREEIKGFLLLLAPYAPFLTEELWSRLGEQYSIHQQLWPSYDEKLAVEERVKVAVQVDGRTRDVIELPADADQEAAVSAAYGSNNVIRHLHGVKPTRIIYAKGRTLNFVTR